MQKKWWTPALEEEPASWLLQSGWNHLLPFTIVHVLWAQIMFVEVSANRDGSEVDESLGIMTWPHLKRTVRWVQGRPIGRANGAPALGPSEPGAPAQLVVLLAVVEISDFFDVLNEIKAHVQMSSPPDQHVWDKGGENQSIQEERSICSFL
jgi:hypothetical protein